MIRLQDNRIHYYWRMPRCRDKLISRSALRAWPWFPPSVSRAELHLFFILTLLSPLLHAAFREAARIKDELLVDLFTALSVSVSPAAPALTH